MSTKPTLDERKLKHLKDAKYGSNLYFHRALQKYGIDNFKWCIVENNVNNSILGEREKFWIEYHNTYYKNEKGYNMTFGGEDAIISNKITPTQVEEIIQLLRETDLPQQTIGDRYDLTNYAISDINTGKSWHNSTLKYPIRELKTKAPKRLSQEEKDEIVILLKTTETHRQEIAEMYNVELSAINRLNNKFNARANVGAKRKLSFDDFYEIVDLLKNTKITAVDIASKFGVHSNTILCIDKGRSWSKYYSGDYPIRSKK